MHGQKHKARSSSAEATEGLQCVKSKMPLLDEVVDVMCGPCTIMLQAARSVSMWLNQLISHCDTHLQMSATAG